MNFRLALTWSDTTGNKYVQILGDGEELRSGQIGLEVSIPKWLEYTGVMCKTEIVLSPRHVQKLLETRLCDFDFSVRVSNIFGRMGINTLMDLLAYNEHELMSEDGFGAESLTEVKSVLKNFGLTLKEET